MVFAMPVLKAMIYVTSPQGVLVFEEPASPHIGLQVPGGTIEQGEDAMLAAERELFEGTGLKADRPLRLLGSIDFKLTQDNRPYVMRHYYYHASLAGSYPASWEHYEMHPSDGGEPILFHLFWLPFNQARQRLEYGMAELLHHIQLDATSQKN